MKTARIKKKMKLQEEKQTKKAPFVEGRSGVFRRIKKKMKLQEEKQTKKTPLVEGHSGMFRLRQLAVLKMVGHETFARAAKLEKVLHQLDLVVR